MKEITLSIVIPAFNVEGFIERCISSVLQPDTEQYVEIIVVNDGSTDQTGNIVQRMSASSKQVHVIHQPNGGLGAARNCGLQHAHGEYIWFVDGDDFIPELTIAKLHMALRKQAPDIVVVDFSCADESGNRIDWIVCPFSIDHGKTMSGGGFFRRHFATTYACLYIIRRELLEEHNLRFQPRINMQDAEFLPRLMTVASSVFICGVSAYAYVKRAGSFINNPDPSVREQYFKSVLEVRRRLVKFLQEIKEPAIREGVIAKLSSIDGILLRAYVYDPLDEAALSARLSLLLAEDLHPFAPRAGASAKDRFLRIAVNVQPLFFPGMYRWLRRCRRDALGYNRLMRDWLCVWLDGRKG